MKWTPASAHAFVEYADDTEGMRFKVVTAPSGKITVKPAGDYDPVCVAAVKRNFKQEWRAFGLA